jgi:hypothetical protein
VVVPVEVSEFPGAALDVRGKEEVRIMSDREKVIYYLLSLRLVFYVYFSDLRRAPRAQILILCGILENSLSPVR